MLRTTIYAIPIVMPTMEAAPAQEDTQRIQSMPGYSNMRTQEERGKDREIDRAYKSTLKAISNTEKKKSDPWGDVRPAPPAAAKNNE